MYTDGSVTKDQWGWGFTVKQDATTIHEDSASYTVSTSSLTMEVEAVTHALRCIDYTCHDRPRFNELETQSEEWNGKPRLECVDGQNPP